MTVTFDEYQHSAARTANTRLDPESRFTVSSIGLAAEAGELLSLIQKHIEQGVKVETGTLALELGDILWRVADICNASGLDMGEVANKNIRKLRARYPDGFSAQASIERRDVTYGIESD